MAPEKGDPNIATQLKQSSYEVHGREREEIENEIQEKYNPKPNLSMPDAERF